MSEVHPVLDAARMARIIVEAAAERVISARVAVRVTDLDTVSHEDETDGGGVEAELGADGGKRLS